MLRAESKQLVSEALEKLQALGSYVDDGKFREEIGDVVFKLERAKLISGYLPFLPDRLPLSVDETNELQGQSTPYVCFMGGVDDETSDQLLVGFDAGVFLLTREEYNTHISVISEMWSKESADYLS